MRLKWTPRDRRVATSSYDCLGVSFAVCLRLLRGRTACACTCLYFRDAGKFLTSSLRRLAVLCSFCLQPLRLCLRGKRSTRAGLGTLERSLVGYRRLTHVPRSCACRVLLGRCRAMTARCVKRLWALLGFATKLTLRAPLGDLSSEDWASSIPLWICLSQFELS